MATLTPADYQEIQQAIAGSTVKPTFKAWGLNRTTWMALFQAAETWFTNGFLNTPPSSFKAALEAVAGTMTNQQAIAIGKIWMQWRFSK